MGDDVNGDDRLCDECAEKARNAVVAAIVAGALIGAGITLFVVAKAAK